MQILKILFFCLLTITVSGQNVKKTPQEVYNFLKANQFEKIFQLLDTTHIPKLAMDMQKEKLQATLTEYGKPKKLENIFEQDAGVKKEYSLPIQFSKKKKNLFIVINSNQKIEQLKITDYSLNPFFQLQGYKGFSEVTDLSTQVNCKDGVTLGANIAFGDTSKQKIPIAILVHGSGSHDRDMTYGPNKIFRDFAQGLAQQGVASLRYDKRGYDYIHLSQKQLDSIDLYSETINDVLDAIKAAKQFTFIDTTKIYIIGHSQGAMCAPQIATLSKDVKGIIMMAGPAKNLIDILPQQSREMALLDDTISTTDEIQINRSKWFAEKIKDPKESKKLPYKAMGLVSEKYWQSILNFHQIDIAKKLTIPILILNGENDFQVSMTEFELWKTELQNHTNTSFKSYPKLNHMFLETIGKRGMQEYDQRGHIPQYVIDDLIKFITK